MPVDKVIVTNKSALKAKYGNKYTRVAAAINRLVKADADARRPVDPPGQSRGACVLWLGGCQERDQERHPQSGNQRVPPGTSRARRKQPHSDGGCCRARESPHPCGRATVPDPCCKRIRNPRTEVREFSRAISAHGQRSRVGERTGRPQPPVDPHGHWQWKSRQQDCRWRHRGYHRHDGRPADRARTPGAPPIGRSEASPHGS